MTEHKAHEATDKLELEDWPADGLESVAACPVCGSQQRRVLYTGLRDRVFFCAPGEWSLHECLGCGTAYLDPCPTPETIHLAYQTYFTHQTSTPPPSWSPLSELLGRVRAAYLHARYEYKPLSSSWADRILRFAAYLHPAWKDGLDASVFHLNAIPGGHLLEVGCGSGAALQSMQQKGWCVTGLDFDAGAVDNARSKGLDVRHGQLSAQAFADQTFDAVVMGHVIEHVHSPIELLAECRRILKKGGILVVLTPNVNSRGHRHYGRNWRGLEPPRHLQIFSPESLASIAVNAGYVFVKTFTSMNGFVYQDLASAELAAGKKHVMGRPVATIRRILSHMKALGFGWRHVLLPGNDGVEAVLVCRK